MPHYRRDDLDENLLEMVRLFQEETWSVRKIAKKFACSEKAIATRLRQAGCEINLGHRFEIAEEHPYWRGEDSGESKLAWLLQEKDNPCSDCGLQWPSYVMEFDHVPERGSKLFMVNTKATSMKYALAELKEERAKCDLVCRNCHAIRTHVRGIPPKTHCKNGHEYTPENTTVTSRGRFCRTCRRQMDKRRRGE